MKEHLFTQRNFLTIGLARVLQISIPMGIWFTAACGSGEIPTPPPGTLTTTSNGQPAKACATDGDCSAPQPYCFGGICVQCLSNNNCGGRQCGPTHECVECTSNADCGGPVPYCSTTTFQCVQCVGPSNCAQGQTCNAENQCVFACSSDSQCTPIAPYCSPTLGTCVMCATDANCGGGAPYCNTAVGACVQCLTDANCTSGTRGSGSVCRGFRCR